MKRLLALLFFASVCTSWAVPTLVQTNGKDSGSVTQQTITLPSVAIHSWLGLGVRVGAGATVSGSITDTSSNTWALVGSAETDDGGNVLYVYNVIDSAASAGTLTITINLNTSATCRLVVLEVSGCSPATPVDKTAQTHGTSTTAASGATATTTQANELLVGFIENSNGQTFTPLGSWVARQTIGSKLLLETQSVTSTGAYNANATLGASDAWAAFCVTLRQFTGATPTATATATASPTPTATATASPPVGCIHGVCNAASASYADVLAAYNLASRGETVVVPSGTPVTWNSTLTLTKGIRLMGPGRDSLTITNNSGTVILIQPDATAIANDETIRVEGFTFVDSSPYMIYVKGPEEGDPKAYKNLAIGNCRFRDSTLSSTSSGVIAIKGQVRGAIFGNIFDRCNVVLKIVGNDNTIEWENGHFPFAYGNADNLFFEANTIQYSSSFGGDTIGWIESGQGGRVVARYNTWNGTNVDISELWDIHGFQNWHGGANQGQTGTMIVEYYGNTVINAPSFRVINHRGSWGMFHNNIITGATAGEINASQYGASDLGGSGCCDQVPWGGVGGGTSCSHYTTEINNTYVFNNTVNGSVVDMSPGSVYGCNIAVNVNYWNFNATFGNGTNGIGRGTAAPTTTGNPDGAGFWKCSTFTPTASSAVVQTGHFYKRVAGAWVDYYTPYTYPHPLTVTAATPTPTPTTTPTPTPTPTPTATAPGTSGGIQEIGNGTQRMTTVIINQDSASRAFLNNIGAGNAIVVLGAVYNFNAIPTTVVVTDNLGTTYSAAVGTAITDNGHFRTFIAWGFAPTSGPCTVLVNPQGTNTDFSWTQDEFYGVDPVAGLTNGTDVQGAMVSGVADTATNSHLGSNLIIGVMSHNNFQANLTLTAGNQHTLMGKSEDSVNSIPHIAIFRISYSRSFLPQSVDYSAPSANHTWTLQTYGYGSAPTSFDLAIPAVHIPKRSK